jgi:RNA processing factor Prp31
MENASGEEFDPIAKQEEVGVASLGDPETEQESQDTASSPTRAPQSRKRKTRDLMLLELVKTLRDMQGEIKELKERSTSFSSH